MCHNKPMVRSVTLLYNTQEIREPTDIYCVHKFVLNKFSMLHKMAQLVSKLAILQNDREQANVLVQTQH